MTAEPRISNPPFSPDSRIGATYGSWIQQWRDYARLVIRRPKTTNHYQRSIEEFLVFLDGKQLASTDESDLWAYIGEQMDICGNRRLDRIRTIRGYRCAEGLYNRAPSPPSECASSCPQFIERHPLVIHDQLRAIQSFFSLLYERRLIDRNFVPQVKKVFTRRFPPEDFEESPRVPKLDEIVAMVSGAVHPMRRCCIVLLAKTGFRNYEVRLLTTSG